MMLNCTLQIFPEYVRRFHVQQYIRLGKLSSRGIDKIGMSVIFLSTNRSGARHAPLNPSSLSSAGAPLSVTLPIVIPAYV